MSALMFLKDQLSLVVLLGLILLVLGVLALVVRAATSNEPEHKGPGRQLPRLHSDTLRSSFRQAVELIEANLASRAQRYGLPWVLVLDEGDGSGTLPLAQAGISSALGTDASACAATPGLDWNFFDQGVVIAVQGRYLGGAEQHEGEAEQPWDEFLGLCRSYRPERPFDALVLTIPAALLMNPHPDARLELVRLAKQANRRIWLAQNRFAMRLGIYLCISGAEHVPGFSAFARALPTAQRGGMLGWSSPYDLATSYQSAWVDEALAQTCRTIVDASAELYAAAPGADIATDYFLLPSRLQALQSQLQLYVDELMRPSSYHEPFLLRGLYFCGEASDAAARIAEPAALAVPAVGAQLPAPVPGEIQTQAATLPDALREPAFLRDLFEQKVFAEIGLTRPSGTQHLGRPLLARGLRWAAWGLVVVWAAGLMTGEIILRRQVDALQNTLALLERDSRQALLAVERGERLPSAWHRERTLALVQLMEQIDRNRLWSIFMPGSWPLFDDLPRRTRERLENSFGEVAVNALRQGLYERTAKLASVSQDSATGELISGAPCAAAVLPGGNERAEVTTLSLEELPEFRQLLGFIGASEQIDQATQALQRLLDPSVPARGSDLSLLVRVVLGAELPSSTSYVAQLFHSLAARNGGFNTRAMQQALQCTLQRNIAAFEKRAFDENKLLVTQRALAQRIGTLANGDADQGGPQPWQQLLDALKEQEALLASDGGAWLAKPTLQPGGAWAQALDRIAALRLLGPEASQQARAASEAAFLRLRTELAGLSDPGQPFSVSWNGKDGRWVSAPEARALRDALQSLLAQPWMSLNRTRTLGDANAPAVISWDLVRLDQALGVAELRKRVQAEQLPRFPVQLQAGVAALVDHQLAAQVMEHLAAGLIPGGRALGSDVAALDAERSRLPRIQALLAELGARNASEQLKALLQRDAVARLRQLDDALDRAELYAPQRRGFSAWNGEKSPVLAAYAMPDAAALAVYLGQQQEHVEALGRSAELLLQGLPASARSSNLRWSAIVRDLERYRLKNPNSSLLALENFLLAMAGDVDASNCGEQLARLAQPGRGGDFFASRQQQLAASLQQRCQQLRGQKQRQSWQQFSAQFNRTASGRPPFAPAPWRADAPALDREELQSLLQGWDSASRNLREVGGRQQAARSFLDQFARHRDFLAPLLPAEDGNVPGYDLAVEFRANAPAEVEGNKIIDWRLASGQQQIGWQDTPRPLHWEPGLPLTLTLRLAKDGPAVPRAESRQPALRVEDRTVTLRYADPWALMNLLASLQVADPGSRADSRSQLLKVEFPLLLLSDANGQGWSETRARVYLRLRISPAGKRTPLAWPGPAPTRAPEI